MQDAATNPPTTQADPMNPTVSELSHAVEGDAAEVLGQESMLPSVLLVGGLALATFILLRRVYRRPASKQHDMDLLSARERIEAMKQHAAMPDREQIGRVTADAEELTRRLAATLDNKAARLEILMDQAEATIARLEQAAAGAAMSASQVPITESDTPRSVSRQRINPSLLDQARLSQLSREQTGATESAPDGAASGADAIHDADALNDEPSPEATRELVYTKSDDGQSALEIAAALQLPVGQVELLLNLRRQTG